MKLVFRYLFFIALICVFNACQFKDDVSQQQYILLDKGNLNFEVSSGQVQKFVIKSNVDWELKTSDSWVNFSITAGNGDKEIEVSCTENKYNSARTAVISVVSSAIVDKKQINVGQLGIERSLDATLAQKRFVDNPSNYGYINILSNVPWKITVDSAWLKVHFLKGGSSTEVPIRPESNFTVKNRSSRVFVSSTDPQYIKTDTLIIEQERAVCDVATNNCYLPPEAFNVIYPGNNSTVYKNFCPSFKDEMIITWEASKDPEGQSVAYDLYLDNQSNPPTLIAKDLLKTEFIYDFTSLNEGTYYVKALVRDASGNKTFSPVNTFKIAKSAIYPNVEIVAGNNSVGWQPNQLSYASDLFVTADRTIYIADQENNRIQKWERGATSGTTVAGGFGAGASLNQVYSPHSVYYDNARYLYVSELGNSRVTKWQLGVFPQSAQIVAGSAGVGADLDQLNRPAGLFLNNHGTLFVCDGSNNRVLRFYPGQTKGTVVAGGNGEGDGLNQLNYPHNLFVDKAENLYIADERNHRIVKWVKGATSGILVAGGNGRGNALNQLNQPRSVILDECKNIYIVDYANRRIVKYANEGIIGGTNEGVVISTTTLKTPHSMFIAPNGDIYISNDGYDINTGTIGPSFIERWSK